MSLILLVISIALGSQVTAIAQQKPAMFRITCGEVPRDVSRNPHPPEIRK